MSLVGPRPLSRSHADTLTAATRSALLMVRPGLSSPAALAFLADDEVLSGRADAEAVYLERLLPAKAALDLEYVERWTLASDLRIALQTPLQVWSRRHRDRSANLVRDLLERR
jgi:lipopolysaccharide/colanic/teichoic acid biosynthesis glycosyltransferase